MAKKTIAQQILERLREFANDLKSGTAKGKYKIIRLVRRPKKGR